jgi:hypothetical protein
MNKVESDYEEILIVDYFCNNEKEKTMKTVMRKKRFLTISGIACILLLTLLWQNTSLACWDTYEEECSDLCITIGNPQTPIWLWAAGYGGWHCFCTSGSEYSECDEEDIGICWKEYWCSQEDCEGTCTYEYTHIKRRCLVEE